VQQEIEDIDRSGECTLGKHSDLLEQMRLRLKGSQPEEQGDRHEHSIG